MLECSPCCMGDSIYSLHRLGEVARYQILHNGERELVPVRFEAWQFGNLLALVFTSDSTSDVPSIFKESEGNVGCDESGNTGNEHGLGAGHYVLLEHCGRA